MNISYILTDRFLLLCHGRTASRSFFSDILGREYEQDLSNTISVQSIFKSLNHLELKARVKIPRILLLREPIDRAKSGIRMGYWPLGHGAPFLYTLDIEKIDYIIPFEETHQYTNTRLGTKEADVSKKDFIWSIDDYDFTKELEIYEKIRKTVPVLDPEKWNSMVRQITECNLPNEKGLRRIEL
jgi:hypothetical protein